MPTYTVYTDDEISHIPKSRQCVHYYLEFHGKLCPLSGFLFWSEFFVSSVDGESRSCLMYSKQSVCAQVVVPLTNHSDIVLTRFPLQTIFKRLASLCVLSVC